MTSSLPDFHLNLISDLSQRDKPGLYYYNPAFADEGVRNAYMPAISQVLRSSLAEGLPPAGMRRGVMQGLPMCAPLTQAQQDEAYTQGVNPVRHHIGGAVVWGATTYWGVELFPFMNISTLEMVAAVTRSLPVGEPDDDATWSKYRDLVLWSLVAEWDGNYGGKCDLIRLRDIQSEPLAYARLYLQEHAHDPGVLWVDIAAGMDTHIANTFGKFFGESLLRRAGVLT